jgi:hypothetical protein
MVLVSGPVSELSVQQICEFCLPETVFMPTDSH